MEFGRLSDISGVDFTLPPDGLLLLPNHEPQNLKVYIGPPIWSNKTWLGKIYPHHAKDSEFLFHYARQFNTIELNVTHYQIPNDAVISRWKSQIEGEFTFCPKFPQQISHERQLIGADGLTAGFVKQVMKLEQHLGVSFLQLPPYFGFNRLSVLLTYLKSLPKELETAVEFRHPTWFENRQNWEITLTSLAEIGVSTVITDVAGRRDVLHMSLSSGTLVLRFIANNLHKTDFTRTNEWVDRLKLWQACGLKKAYLFIHTEENNLAPELSNFWVQQLNQKLHLGLKPAVIQPEIVQGSLF